MFRKMLMLLSSLLFSHLSFAQPGLSTGDQFPHFIAMDIQGAKVDTKALIQQGPLVVLFYRGGWCPFCSRQLQAVNQEVLPVLKELNGRIIAISVDKPEEAKISKGNLKDDWMIISDNKAEIIKTMKLEFKVPDDLVQTYKEKYKIDLEASSGEKHHLLPIPAVYVLGKDGKIIFAYANEDYKIRAANKDVNAALKAMQKGG